MINVIKDELLKIEQNHHVRILYACESGSRAWGFPSKDSDYDVRFIYIHHPDWYLSIDEKRDVIEIPINDLLDIKGWDIRKALKLLRKSNPPLQEWLLSEIVYYSRYSFVDQMKELSSDVFSPIACFHHYLSMARGNYREYVQSEQVKIKTCFNVLRPLLACKWIETNHSMPPILFQDLVCHTLSNGELKNEITTLLARKIKGEELDLEPRVDRINEFIDCEIPRLEEYIKGVKHELPDPTHRLDDLFRRTLSEVWTT